MNLIYIGTDYIKQFYYLASVLLKNGVSYPVISVILTTAGIVELPGDVVK